MENLAGNLIDLILLILLQAVLGFDNLLYVSLESKRAPKDKQVMVRRLGIALAVVLRLVLLFVLIHLIDAFTGSLFKFDVANVAKGDFNLHSLIVLMGGVFILYTAMKEIFHMMALEESHQEKKKPKSTGAVIFWIVLMNAVFSFDSILGAIALTKVFWVMATAIITGGALMILLADSVSHFLQKNRMYEVLGLFVLFIVGIMLLSEGAHLSHLHLFGHEITAMSKANFYFVIGTMVLIEIVQGRYQRKLMLAKAANAPELPNA